MTKTSVAISREWFEEIKAEVEHSDEYYYTENGREYVEVDVNEEQFNEVSETKGWM